MKILVRAAVCCVLFGLAGCGQLVETGNSGPELPSNDGSTAAAAAPDAAVNERGFIVKQLGEQACFGGAGTNCEGGVTRDAGIGMCADPSAGLPDTFGPNQQYSGVIDIEVPGASGTIALQLFMPDENGERGWEWTYPV